MPPIRPPARSPRTIVTSARWLFCGYFALPFLLPPLPADGQSIAEVFPARGAEDDPAYPDGQGWDAHDQAMNQLYALLTTLAIAIGSGLLVGWGMSKFGKFDEDLWYAQLRHRFGPFLTD